MQQKENGRFSHFKPIFTHFRSFIALARKLFYVCNCFRKIKYYINSENLRNFRYVWPFGILRRWSFG